MQNVNTRPFLAAFGMLLLFSFSCLSIVQAQEKSNKKIIIKHKIVNEDGDVQVIEKVIDNPDDEMIIIEESSNKHATIRIQSTGDLTVENEVIVLPEGIEVIIDKKMDCDKGSNLFFPGNTFSVAGREPFFGNTDPNTESIKVYKLAAGAQIPDEIKQDIIDMGLDVETVQAQFDAAERMVRLQQTNDETAIIEVDGPQPENIKRLLEDDSYEIEIVEDFNFDFNFDYEFEGDESILDEDNPWIQQFLENRDGEDHSSIFKLRNLPEGEGNSFFNKSSCEEKAQLGTYIGETTEKGIEISSIVEGSAAEKAGLQAGDILTAINGKAVSEMTSLTDEIRAFKVGETVSVSFEREGNMQTVETTLQALKNEYNWSWSNHDGQDSRSFWKRDDHNHCESLCKSPFLGVYITDSYGDEESENGVEITGIFAGTEAEKIGLQEDDMILSIDGITTNSTRQIISIISDHEPGDVVDLVYLQNGARQQTQATIGRKSDAKKYDYCDCDNLEESEVELATRKELILIKETPEATVAPEVIEEAGPSLFEDQPAQPLFNNQLELSDFQLFPNPNSGRFTISFNSGSEASISVTVVDASGKEMFREDIQSFNGNYQNNIDLSNQAPGFYFVNVLQDGNVFIEKFAISRD